MAKRLIRLFKAKVLAESWLIHYNNLMPHSNFNMIRVQCSMLFFLMFIICSLSSCFTIRPRTYKNRNIDIQVNEEKIIVKINTRRNPERYLFNRVDLADNLFSWRTLNLYPFNEENIVDSRMYHPSFGYEMRYFEFYIHEGIYVIEIDKIHIPDDLIGFNSIAILFQSPFEYYIYETGELFYLWE